MSSVKDIVSIDYESEETSDNISDISNHIEAPQAEFLDSRLNGEDLNYDLLDEFERRSGQEYKAIIEFEDGEHEEYDIIIRSDVDANSPANPFSLYELNSRERNQKFLVRKARTYDPQLLCDARNIEPHVLVEDLDDLEQQPGRYDDNTAYLIPEAELVTMALEDGGLDDQAIGNESYAPITRSNLRFLEKSEEVQENFGYVEEEFFYITDFLPRPFDVTITDQKIENVAKRIATDRELGIVLNTDRKPGEFCLDHHNEFGEYILNVDPEFPLLATHEERQEIDQKDAVDMILKAIANNAENSGGVKDTTQMRDDIETLVQKHRDNMPALQDYIYDRLSEDIDPTKINPI